MGKKILVVDDSKTVRLQVGNLLSKSGYVMVEAEDGVDGIAKLKGNPDIVMVISDVNMPNMNGLQMVDAIKADAAYAALPIVMLTTEASVELLEKAKKAGVKGWLVKPFKPEQLSAAVTKLAG